MSKLIIRNVTGTSEGGSGKVSMSFQYNDGGREEAGYRGEAGDCVCRAIAIASGLPYKGVYDSLANGTGEENITKYKGASGKKTARSGIHVSRQWFKSYMESLGFKWTPTMGIGTGCKVHLSDGELPKGNLVVSVSKHYTAVIDGIIMDTHNPDREGTRCVYGYWKLVPSGE